MRVDERSGAPEFERRLPDRSRSLKRPSTCTPSEQVEACVASSTVLRNMHGLNSELQGFGSSLSAAVTSEDIPVTPPVYI